MKHKKKVYLELTEQITNRSVKIKINSVEHFYKYGNGSQINTKSFKRFFVKEVPEQVLTKLQGV